MENLITQGGETSTEANTVEQYLHVRDCMLSSVVMEKYYRSIIESTLNDSRSFALILASKNHVITGHLLYNKSTDKRVSDWLVKALSEASGVATVVLLDVCHSENFIIDNDIINYAYVLQDRLIEKKIEVVFHDYALVSPAAYISLYEKGLL